MSNTQQSRIARLEHEERVASKAMLQNPDSWQAMTSRGFGCHVKKRSNVPGKWPECGVVIEDKPTTVVIFDTKGKFLKEYPFESLDAMLNDGWVVD